jgi:hypothetical protein
MKRVLFIVLLACSVLAHASIAVVSHPTAVTHSTASTTCANGTAITGSVGDFVAIAQSVVHGSSVTSGTDNASTPNKYIKGPSIDNSSGGHVEIWWTILRISATTVTATIPSQKNSCAVIEYSGVTGVNGTYATNTGSSAAPTITFTTKGASSWTLVAMSDAVSTNTWSAGSTCSPTAACTLESNIAGGSATTPGIAVEDDGVIMSAGSVTVNAALSGSLQWAVGGMELYSVPCLGNRGTLGVGCK